MLGNMKQFRINWVYSVLYNGIISLRFSQKFWLIIVDSVTGSQYKGR